MEYFNKLLRKGSAKKAEAVDSSPKCHRTFTKENEVEPDFISSQHSTPKKLQECDAESDTTAEYESAGEASPWGKEPNLSALADCLEGVHLSTPNKKVPFKLNHFPFSPISAEDETDEEVKAITSNNSEDKVFGSLSLMEEEVSPKPNLLNDGKNTPFEVISSSQVLSNLNDGSQDEISHEKKCSKDVRSDSFRVITESPADVPNTSAPGETVEISSSMIIKEKCNQNVISPSVEFQDAGPACSFHSGVMSSIESQLLSGTPNSSLLSNHSLISEECRHIDTVQNIVLKEDYVNAKDVISEQNSELKYTSINNKSYSGLTNQFDKANISSSKLVAFISSGEELTTFIQDRKTENVENLEAYNSKQNIVNLSNKIEEIRVESNDLEVHNFKNNEVENIVSVTEHKSLCLKNSHVTNEIPEGGLPSSLEEISNSSIELDLNKSVSLKDILIDKSSSFEKQNDGLSNNLPFTAESECIEQNSDKHGIKTHQEFSSIDSKAVEVPLQGEKLTNIMEYESKKSVVSENILVIEKPLELPVTPLHEIGSDDIITAAKFDSPVTCKNINEEICANLENMDIKNDTNQESVNETINFSNKKMPPFCLDECSEAEVTLSSLEKISNDTLSSVHFANENAEKNSNNSQLKDSECAFTQNSTDVSENVFRFANEKHPVCLEELLEATPSENNVESIDNLSMKVSECIGDIDKDGKSCSNISISEMCNLIETTFNNSLKENLNDICEKITNSNLKPSLLLGKEEVDNTPVPTSSALDTASISPPSSVEVSDFEPTQDNQNASHSENVQGAITDRGIPLQKDTTLDGLDHLLPKIIGDNSPSTKSASDVTLSSKKINLSEASLSDISLLNQGEKNDDVFANLNEGHKTSQRDGNLLSTSTVDISAEKNKETSLGVQIAVQGVNIEETPSFSPLLDSCTSLKLTDFNQECSETSVTTTTNENGLENSLGPVALSVANFTESNINTTDNIVAPSVTSGELSHSACGLVESDSQINFESTNMCSFSLPPSDIPSCENKEMVSFSGIDSKNELPNGVIATKNAIVTDNTNSDSLKDIKRTVTASPCTESLSKQILNELNVQTMAVSFPVVENNNVQNENEYSLVGGSSDPTVMKISSEIDICVHTSDPKLFSNAVSSQSNVCVNESVLESMKGCYASEEIHTSVSTTTSARDIQESFISGSEPVQEDPSSKPFTTMILNEVCVPCTPDKVELLGNTHIDNQSNTSKPITATNGILTNCDKPKNSESSFKEPEKSFERNEVSQFQMIENLTSFPLKNGNVNRSNDFSELIEVMVNMKVSSKEKSVLSEEIIEVTKTSNDISHHEGTKEKQLPSQCTPKEVESSGIDKDLPFVRQTETSEEGVTSAGNGLEKRTNVSIAQGKMDQTKTIPLESASVQSPKLITGKMTTENEGYASSLAKTRNLSQSSPNKGVMQPKKNTAHSVSKVDKLNNLTPERKSYEDLLDKCLRQEKLLDFDDSFKEEANKIAQELEKSSDCAISTESESNALPSPNVNISEAGPITADEDAHKEDIFQDASNFDFEYLSKIRGKPCQRKLIRESLFLKFDPLATSSSPDPGPAMEKLKPQPDSSSNDFMVTPPRSTLSAEEQQLVNITPIAIHSASPANSNTPRVKTRPSSATTTPTVRPDIVSKEIYKLQDLMLKQELSYQEQIAACMEEIEDLKQQLADLEAQEPQHELEEKLINAESEIEELKKKLDRAEADKTELLLIVEEYDATLNGIVQKKGSECKKLQADVEALTLERDEASQHLRNMEIAFNDIHQKYEKSKEAIVSFKANEAQFKLALAENEKTIKQQQDNYQKLKEHASQKLEEANSEILEMKKAHQVEVATLGAMNRKLEIQVKTLQESIEQKKIEVVELTKICDELITKFPHK